jgi:hypothetical protein
VEVDAQLLLHGGFVLDHQYRRAEDLSGPVNLEAGRQRREPNLSILATLALKTVISQGLSYTIFNDYWHHMNNQSRTVQCILGAGPGSSP